MAKLTEKDFVWNDYVWKPEKYKEYLSLWDEYHKANKPSPYADELINKIRDISYDSDSFLPLKKEI